MKFIGQIKDVLKTLDGRGIITLEIDNRLHASFISALEQGKQYSVEIKEIKSKRSLQQNSYMWALLREIDVAINGRPTDEWDYYIMALERANAKSDYIVCYPEAEEMLKEQFRAVKFVQRTTMNNHEANVYKVFSGSSKMNKQEMNILIEKILDIASEVGLETEYWKAVFNEVDNSK